jgi:DNA-binding NarL/FixJ family response regulator
VGVLVIRVLLADDQVLVRAGFRLLLESAGDIAVVGEAANGGVAVALAREHAPDVVLMDLHMPEVDGVTATRLIAGDPDLAATKVVVLTTFDDEETVFAALRAGASGFLVKDVEPAELLQAVRVVARGDALLSPSVTRAVISAFTDNSRTGAAGAAGLARAAGLGRAPTPPVAPVRPADLARPAGAAPGGAGTGGAGTGGAGPDGAGPDGAGPGGAGPGGRAGAARPGVAALTDREREVVALVAAGLSNDEIAQRLVVSPLTAKTHVSRAMIKLNARDRAQLVVFAYENGLTKG